MLLQPSDRETRFGCLPSFNSHRDLLPGGYSRRLHFNSPAGLAGFCPSLRRDSSGSLRAGSSQSIPHPAAACQDRQWQAEMLHEESPPTGILGEGDHPVETRRRSHRDAGRRRNGACWWVPWGWKRWPHAGPGGGALVGLGCAAGSSRSRAASWPHGLGIQPGSGAGTRGGGAGEGELHLGGMAAPPDNSHLGHEQGPPALPGRRRCTHRSGTGRQNVPVPTGAGGIPNAPHGAPLRSSLLPAPPANRAPSGTRPSHAEPQLPSQSCWAGPRRGRRGVRCPPHSPPAPSGCLLPPRPAPQHPLPVSPVRACQAAPLTVAFGTPKANTHTPVEPPPYLGAEGSGRAVPARLRLRSPRCSGTNGSASPRPTLPTPPGPAVTQRGGTDTGSAAPTPPRPSGAAAGPPPNLRSRHLPGSARHSPARLGSAWGVAGGGCIASATGTGWGQRGVRGGVPVAPPSRLGAGGQPEEGREVGRLHAWLPTGLKNNN